MLMCTRTGTLVSAEVCNLYKFKKEPYTELNLGTEKVDQCFRHQNYFCKIKICMLDTLQKEVIEILDLTMFLNILNIS